MRQVLSEFLKEVYHEFSQKIGDGGGGCILRLGLVYSGCAC